MEEPMPPLDQFYHEYLADDPATAETVRRAAAIQDYFSGHDQRLLELGARFHNALPLYSRHAGRKISGFRELPVQLPDHLLELLEAFTSKSGVLSSRTDHRAAVLLNMVARWARGQAEREWCYDLLVAMSPNPMAWLDIGRRIEQARHQLPVTPRTPEKSDCI
jgi:hypothetical protein